MAMSGMEMMLTNMLKGMGLNPEELKGQAQKAQEIVNGLDKRVSSIEEKLDLIYEKVCENHSYGPYSISDTLAVRITEVPESEASN